MGGQVEGHYFDSYVVLINKSLPQPCRLYNNHMWPILKNVLICGVYKN